MREFLNSLLRNPIVILLAVAVVLDMLLGVLRAIRERGFNSSAGIDGGIRKAAMLLSVVAFAWVDSLVHINLSNLLPDQWQGVLGMPKIGLCELFGVLFILFEAASILKNLVLCGAPVPGRLKRWVLQFLSQMTHELPDESGNDLQTERMGRL